MDLAEPLLFVPEGLQLELPQVLPLALESSSSFALKIHPYLRQSLP